MDSKRIFEYVYAYLYTEDKTSAKPPELTEVLSSVTNGLGNGIVQPEIHNQMIESRKTYFQSHNENSTTTPFRDPSLKNKS